MTYGELYRETERLVGSSFEAGQLFTHVTNKHMMHLQFVEKKDAPEKVVDLLLKMCMRRRRGEPLQYLLGEWEFYGLPFKVGRGVLIPRADTETLVDVSLQHIAGLEHPEVLDLCSGSGCVAIALNHERPDAKVTAVELSDAAFAFLQYNKDINNSPIEPVRADLMEYTHPDQLDLLVSNPPYIPKETIAKLQREVQYEPRKALDGGMDGLDFYRSIVRLYTPQLKPGGWICLEVGIGQNERVGEILKRAGYTGVGYQNDYGGIPRVVYAQR